MTKSILIERGDACGPWGCGYILYANQGKDKYDFFYNNASSFGELCILNFALQIFLHITQ